MAPTTAEDDCMFPCDFLCGTYNEEADTGTSLGIICIEEDGAADAYEGRGRRLTSEDFIGESPVIAVKKKFYKIQRIRSKQKRLLRDSMSWHWGQKSPRIVQLTPVPPDTLFFGGAGSSSQENLTTTRMTPTPESAVLYLVQSLLDLQAEEKTAEWILRGPVQGAKGMEADKAVVEKSFMPTTVLRETFSVTADGITEADVLPSMHPDSVDATEDEAKWRLAAIERALISKEQFQTTLSRTCQLERELQKKKQDVSKALKTLALQRRLLRASGSLLPTHLLSRSIGLAPHGKNYLSVVDSRVSVHLLNFCDRLVTALAMERSKLVAEAIDTVYSVCEQHRYLIGCIQALSSAFQKVTDFRSYRERQETIHRSIEAGEIPEINAQDNWLFQESRGSAESPVPSNAAKKGKAKRKKVGGKKGKAKQKDVSEAPAKAKGTPVGKAVGPWGAKTEGKPEKALKTTKAVKRRASRKGIDQASSGKKKPSLTPKSHKAKPAPKKKSDLQASTGADTDASLKAKVSKKVKGSIVDNGIPSTTLVVACKLEQFLPAMEVAGNAFNAISRPEKSLLHSYSPSSSYTSLPLSTYPIVDNESSELDGNVCLASGVLSEPEMSPRSWPETVKSAFNRSVCVPATTQVDPKETCEKRGAAGQDWSGNDPTEDRLSDERFSILVEPLDISALEAVPESYLVALTCSDVALSAEEETTTQRSLSGVEVFEHDALISLPSKTFRRSILSTVGAVIRGETSLFERKHSDELPFRASTFPRKVRANATTGGNAIKPIKKTTQPSESPRQATTLSRRSTSQFSVGRKNPQAGSGVVKAKTAFRSLSSSGKS